MVTFFLILLALSVLLFAFKYHYSIYVVSRYSALIKRKAILHYSAFRQDIFADILLLNRRRMIANRSLKELLAKAVVADYISPRIVTLDSKSSVLDIVKAMSDRNISSVAIAENNKIVGILTERDIVKIVANAVSLDRAIAASLVFPTLVSISKNSSLQTAAKLMAQKRVRHLFVEDPDNRKIIGIVTTTDLVRYLKQVLSSHEAELMLLEVLYPSEEEGEKQFWQ